MKYAKRGCYIPSCAYYYISRKNIGIIRGIDENNKAAEKWFYYADVFDLIIDDSYKGFDEFKKQIKMMKVWHSSTAVRVLAHYGESDSPEYVNMRKYIKENMIEYLKARYIGAKRRKQVCWLHISRRDLHSDYGHHNKAIGGKNESFCYYSDL